MKRYQIILCSNNDGTRFELPEAPRGWDATKFNVVRDAVYFGVLKAISVEFEFMGVAYQYLQNKRLQFGVDADVQLRMYYKNIFLMSGKLNFENYNEDRKLRLFKVDVIQSGKVQDFTNREDVELNIFNTITLDRKPVSPAERKPCTFRGKHILFITKYGFSNAARQEDQAKETYNHIIPFPTILNGNPGTTFVYDVNPDSEDPFEAKSIIKYDNSFYKNDIPSNQTVNVSWDLQSSFAFKGTQPSFGLMIRNRLLLVDSDDNIVTELHRVEYKGNGSSINATYSDVKSMTVVVPFNHGMLWVSERLAKDFGDTYVMMTPEGQDTFSKVETTYMKMDLNIDQVSIVADSNHDIIFPFELFSNLIKQINGGNFYSNFFGRTDVGYTADGEGALVAITKGEILRGIDPATIQLSTSFREAFVSYSSIFCLGAIIRPDGIQIEPLKDLMNTNLITDIGQLENLMIKPAKDYIYNSVKAGYPAQEYEQENGRDEFNTEYQYTNSIRAVKKELDIRSRYYADGYGIEFARRASIIQTGTQDSRYDDKIFFICTKRIGPGFITKTTEDVLNVEGIFSPETALNLDIATGQNMMRHGELLNVPLHRKPKEYYFQSKDKNTGLKLTTAKWGTTNDGENLTLGKRAYFIPEEREGDAPFTLDMLFAIIDNPLGVIGYQSGKERFFDLLYEVDAEADKNMAHWRFLGMRTTPPLIAPAEIGGKYLKWKDMDGAFVKYNDLVGTFVKYKN
jgi:hypothetical protein